MKAKVLLLIVSFACAPTFYSFGQAGWKVDCTTSTKLVCQFPVSAETLSTNTVGSSGTGYVSAFLAAETQARPINASIATQLTQLPIPSATVGVVSLQKKGSDVGVPFENLGPVLTDRPDTVGKGHIFMGFSYQHFNFNALDGVSLGALPVGFQFNQQSAFNPGDTQTFYGAESNNVSFKLDQYVGVVTLGVTKTTDISVILPFNSVTLGVKSSSFQAYLYDPQKGYTNETPAAGTAVTTNGSSSGIGDVTLSLKQLLLGGGGSRTAMATGVALRFHSGDALNYLGSGAYGGNLYGLFEYRGRLAPHVKVSYQWNGLSQVLDLQNAPDIRLPGGLQYAAGADYKVVRPLTLAVDLLGSQFVNTPSFTLGTTSLPSPSTGIPSTITSVTPLNNTYSTVNLSTGVKWSPIPHFLVYGNVLMQLNNVGLRSDPVPLVGISYNFKAM